MAEELPAPAQAATLYSASKLISLRCGAESLVRLRLAALVPAVSSMEPTSPGAELSLPPLQNPKEGDGRRPPRTPERPRVLSPRSLWLLYLGDFATLISPNLCALPSFATLTPRSPRVLQRDPPLRPSVSFRRSDVTLFGQAYMTCKRDDRNPEACLEKGDAVLKCTSKLLQAIKAKCAGEFGKFASCLDYNRCAPPGAKRRRCQVVRVFLPKNACVPPSAAIISPNAALSRRPSRKRH